MKIQIVDDSAEMRSSLRNLLREACGEFCESTNGAEAVEQYESDKPNLVLMDIRMPVMNGFEALRRIRLLDRAAAVAMITQYDDDSYRIRSMQLGAAAFLLKDRPQDIRRFVEQFSRTSDG